MKFPNIVYKCPGSHQCPGGTFAYLPVKNDNDLERALKEGWFGTLNEACGIKKEVPAKKEAPKDEEPDKKEVKVRFDFESLDWNDLRSFAKKLEKEKDLQIIEHGSKREDIIKRLKEVL